MAEQAALPSESSVQGQDLAGPSGERLSKAQQAAIDSATSSDLPHTAPLDHDNAHLSPIKAPHFDVDDFLVSRVPAATLAQITLELERYGKQLEQELGDVVDRDFRGFVNLGAALKAEGPRIARLDWRLPKQKQGDETANHRTTNGIDVRGDTIDTHYDAQSNLGLESVRSELLSVRDDLRTAEDEIRATMAERESCERQQEDLKVLLSFDDTLHRLETMMLAESTKSFSGRDGVDSTLDKDMPFWKAFLRQGEEDDYDSVESEFTDSLSEPSSGADESTSPNARNLARESPISSRQKVSSPLPDKEDRSLSVAKDVDASNLDVQGQEHSPDSVPLRIARAGSEHAALMFLFDRAEKAGFRTFLDAQKDRLQAVRQALRSDIRKLVQALCKTDGTSLLVNNPQQAMIRGRYNDETLTHVLATWSQVNEDSHEKRTAEQESWLEMAIVTWMSLFRHSEDDPTIAGFSELENMIRETLVLPIAQQIINAYASDRSNGAPELVRTDQNSSTHYIDRNAVEKQTQGDGAQLVVMYDAILDFVATRANVIARIADRASASSSSSEATPASCEVFARSLWRTLITETMERLGGQLFFVGRPIDFQRNYTVSMMFVEAFERLAPSSRSLELMRLDSSYATFKKRWQLPVYFQMRLRESVASLESAFTDCKYMYSRLAAAKGTVTGELPLSPAIRLCANLFSLLWTRGRHIDELSARQWRFSLQTVERFHSFIQGELPEEIIEKEKHISGTTGRGPPMSGSGTLSPARSGTPSGRSEASSDDTMTAHCTALAVDVLWYEAQVPTLFDREIAPVIAKAGKGSFDEAEAILQALRETLKEILSFDSHFVPLLRAKVVAALKAQCAEPLRLVRSLSSQYRTAANSVHGKAGTTNNGILEPSYFVTHFLRPIRQYLGKSEQSNRARAAQDGSTDQASASHIALSALLPRNVREEWINEILEDFVSRYTASLHTMNQNYESLQRLKRINSSSSTAGEDDAAGMHRQMIADVDFLEREVRDLDSVDTTIRTDTRAWERLRSAASAKSSAR